MFDLKNKIVLITGASRGIWAATALRFASEWSKVIINYFQNQQEAKQVQETILKNGGKAEIIQANISDPKQVTRLFEQIIALHGTLDILINNAGILGPYDKIENITPEDIKTTFETNLYGAMYCSQEFIRIMKQQNKKWIILFNSSIHGNHEISGNPLCIPYCTTKAALTNFAANLAKSEAPNIRVNTIAPGPTLTPMWDEDTDETKRAVIENTPLKRWTTPEEVADSFVFFAKNEAFTGQTLYI